MIFFTKLWLENYGNNCEAMSGGKYRSICINAQSIDGAKFSYLIDEGGLRADGIPNTIINMSKRRSLERFVIAKHSHDVFILLVQSPARFISRRLGFIDYFRLAPFRSQLLEVGAAFGIVDADDFCDQLRSFGYVVDVMDINQLLLAIEKQ